ncbi:LOW QUALITY PROTEIN: uncharacterized protein LOC115232845 [Formica exsecta]|uniref:LOW QUALITY PROTEIN: uncharacterized protein LOC115232845 n=1 Tax=Formica exsecta TaxID=72781 RepID=UPI0011424156|nr:LOW QUALITY PROTEIN: uncharacterized protein LOC115232845 [Formica exsecta]
MKFLFSALFTILAIIGLGQSHQFPDFGKGPLHEDLQEILDLLPMKRIVRVVGDYMAHDPEVQEAVKFLKITSVFKNLMIDLENIPEVINLLNYLQEEGVESYNLINQINRAVGIKELVPPTISTPTSTPTSTSTPTPTSSSTPTSTPTPTSSSASTPTSSSTPRPTPTSTPSSTPTADLTPEPAPEPTPVSYNVMKRRSWGLAGLFKDVKDLLNYDDFISLYVDKLRYSSAFNDLLNELRSNSQQIVNRLSESESFQIIVTGLKNRNVNLKIVADVLYIVLGVTIPGHSKTLEDEFVDFVKLLPLEKISDIVLKYVNEDKGVQNAILFMFKPEFHDLLRAVETLQEYQELLVFLQNAGVHVIENIQAFHKAIGMEDYVPPKIESFLKSQIKKQEVGGGDSRLSESESFQIIVTGLKNRNVNLKIVADVLYIVLGVTIPGHSKTLEDEFVDFVKLLPLEKISDIVLKYVNEDEGVQNAILFMFKPEFHDLLRAVEALQKYQELLVSLEDAGCHVYENIQAFHKAIGMEDYVPPKIESFLKSQIKKQEVGGGLTAMIRDIYALLPYEKIDALFQEKVNTSTVFAKFVSQVSSPEFENIVNNLAVNEVFLQFITKSNEQGLDLVGLSALSTRIIGLK